MNGGLNAGIAGFVIENFEKKEIKHNKKNRVMESKNRSRFMGAELDQK